MNWWMMSADETCAVHVRQANALRIEECCYGRDWTVRYTDKGHVFTENSNTSTWALRVDIFDNSYTIGEYKTFEEAHEEMTRIVREMNSKEREDV